MKRAQDELDQALLDRIDAEVRAMLDVTPSAGFLARARQAVTETRRPIRWPWALLPAAAAAGLWMLLRPVPPPAAPVPDAGRTAERTPTPAAAPSAERIPAAVLPVTPRPPRPAGPRPGEPEVLIPVQEREALRRYIATLGRSDTLPLMPGGLAAGRTEPLHVPPMQLAPLDLPAAPPQISPIRIALIGVQPLTVLSTNEEE